MAGNDEKLIGALSFDEVALHKLLQFVNNEMLGYENCPIIEPKNAQIASEALVYMFKGINTNLKLPVAYYYANKLDAESKVPLSKDVIGSLLEVGVVLTSITFDGAPTNPLMVKILGADLNVFSDSFDPSFTHNGTQVNVIYDPSHMIKLVRGCLGDKGTLYERDGQSIQWIFFKRLVQYKKQRNFGDTIHKMTEAHMNWHSNPMKVKLAVETLSASTANAMEYLMDQGLPEFKNAAATIRLEINT